MNWATARIRNLESERTVNTLGSLNNSTSNKPVQVGGHQEQTGAQSCPNRVQTECAGGTERGRKAVELRVCKTPKVSIALSDCSGLCRLCGMNFRPVAANVSFNSCFCSSSPPLSLGGWHKSFQPQYQHNTRNWNQNQRAE